MTSIDVRERRKAETREKILAAGRELLLSQGFHGFSLRKLAAKVHYTATAIYLHFPDKDALLGELVDREFIRFRQIFDKTSQISDPIERLRKMGLVFVDFALAQPDVYKILFLNTQVEAFPRIGLIERGNPAQDCYAYLRTTITDAIAAGRFRAELSDQDLVAQVFMGGVHGIVSLHIARGKDPWVNWRPVEQRAQLLIDGLIRGLTIPTSHETHSTPSAPATFAEDLT
ncbi:MAG TPA: TetR/AcrR family transcriptional regulator [Pirellulaceae bacterium]|nr:TetR/AcrR family transcriptional regulator [Pirellulaceae bacterium]